MRSYVHHTALKYRPWCGRKIVLRYHSWSQGHHGWFPDDEAKVDIWMILKSKWRDENEYDPAWSYKEIGQKGTKHVKIKANEEIWGIYWNLPTSSVSLSTHDKSDKRKPSYEQRCKKRPAWPARLCYFPPRCANFWPVYAQNLLSLSIKHRYSPVQLAQLC